MCTIPLERTISSSWKGIVWSRVEIPGYGRYLPVRVLHWYAVHCRKCPTWVLHRLHSEWDRTWTHSHAHEGRRSRGVLRGMSRIMVVGAGTVPLTMYRRTNWLIIVSFFSRALYWLRDIASSEGGNTVMGRVWIDIDNWLSFKMDTVFMRSATSDAFHRVWNLFRSWRVVKSHLRSPSMIGRGWIRSIIEWYFRLPNLVDKVQNAVARVNWLVDDSEILFGSKRWESALPWASNNRLGAEEWWVRVDSNRDRRAVLVETEEELKNTVWFGSDHHSYRGVRDGSHCLVHCWIQHEFVLSNMVQSKDIHVQRALNIEWMRVSKGRVVYQSRIEGRYEDGQGFGIHG